MRTIQAGRWSVRVYWGGSVLWLGVSYSHNPFPLFAGGIPGLMVVAVRA